MSILLALLYGLVQGMTEFLPISSTAHLTVVGRLLQSDWLRDPTRWTAFMAIIQLGTLVAVLVYFARDWWPILRHWLADTSHGRWGKQATPQTNMGWFIIIGTLPIVGFGLLLKPIIEGSLTKSFGVMGTSLIILGLILWWAERRAKHTRLLGQARVRDAVSVGLAQALALIPGASRSGTTLTAGLLCNFKREAAARFSFLLSIPAVLLSGLWELHEVWPTLSAADTLSYVVGVAAAAVSGWLVIHWLLHYLKKSSTLPFVWYRLVLGGLLITLAIIGF